jgi:hypothetical protein
MKFMGCKSRTENNIHLMSNIEPAALRFQCSALTNWATEASCRTLTTSLCIYSCFWLGLINVYKFPLDNFHLQDPFNYYWIEWDANKISTFIRCTNLSLTQLPQPFLRCKGPTINEVIKIHELMDDHSWKEHVKIRKIAKFGREML